MKRLSCILFVAALAIAAVPAMAQIVPLPPPELENRIPAPLPPPAKPPVINGPLSQTAPSRVIVPRPLDTHSDRTTRCLHRGAVAGLRGAELDAYTRACGNAQ
jgi:hypothetical protein